MTRRGINIVAKPKRKQQKEWQFKFTLGLALVMVLLIGGYFFQSFLEIRKVKPVSVALERISEHVEKVDPIPSGKPD